MPFGSEIKRVDGFTFYLFVATTREDGWDILPGKARFIEMYPRNAGGFYVTYGIEG